MNAKAIKCPSLCCFLTVAVTVMWMGCAGTPTHESTGEYIDDSAITTKVKVEYARDPVVKATQASSS